MAPSLLLISVLYISASLHGLCQGQFSPTDGTNDLFALFTQCDITPRYPPDNQFTCYRTFETITPSGFTLCDPRFIRLRGISVADSTSTHSVYFINTPGRLRGANYNNRLLCRWNIRCPEGQLMYYDFPEHNLEEAVTSPFFVDPVCIDYLKISRDFADFFSCGTDTPQGDIEPSQLFVEFRSNRVQRNPGFRMRAVCFNPTAQDSVGCTTMNSFGKREIRDNNEEKKLNFNRPLSQKDHSILRNLRRHKRSLPAAYNSTRDQQYTIQPAAKVVYQRRTITVLEEGKVVLRFKKVNSLHTYNGFDGVTSFYADVIGSKKAISLRGFGVLIVIDDVAYYVIFGADPRFLPNEAERHMIRTLLNAEEALVVDEDFIIKEDEPQQGYNNHHYHGGHNTGNGHGKRDTEEQLAHSQSKRMVSGSTNTGVFSPEIVSMAQSAQNSCSAVLRAVAESILNNI